MSNAHKLIPKEKLLEIYGKGFSMEATDEGRTVDDHWELACKKLRALIGTGKPEMVFNLELQRMLKVGDAAAVPSRPACVTTTSMPESSLIPSWFTFPHETEQNTVDASKLQPSAVIEPQDEIELTSNQVLWSPGDAFTPAQSGYKPNSLLAYAYKQREKSKTVWNCWMNPTDPPFWLVKVNDISNMLGRMYYLETVQHDMHTNVKKIEEAYARIDMRDAFLPDLHSHIAGIEYWLTRDHTNTYYFEFDLPTCADYESAIKDYIQSKNTEESVEEQLHALQVDCNWPIADVLKVADKAECGCVEALDALNQHNGDVDEAAIHLIMSNNEEQTLEEQLHALRVETRAKLLAMASDSDDDDIV